jgi:hypothetical protein
MHFAYTAPLPSAPVMHLASISGDAGPAAFLIAFAVLIVFCALSGSRATFRGVDLDARHRGQVEPQSVASAYRREPIIASGGPVSVAIRNRQPRDARGRFVKVAR